MSKKIRIIVIDPHLQTISEDTIDDSLNGLQHAIGDHNIEMGFMSDKDIMYVDEEGLYRENQAFFVFEKRPFAGKAIILGNDPIHGKTKGTKTTVATIAASVGFHSAAEIVKMNLGY